MGDTVVGTGTVVITADTTQYQQAMGAVPTPAAKAAKQVSAGFSGEFNKVSSAAAAMAGQVGGQ